jgi:UDP-N-acetylglucosamine--N-acetylmuramyl-(pentapeptide) pyrophosphoryl-undecaprenol N-acetylglucosamine transferase
LPQSELSAQRLADELRALTRSDCQAMAQAARLLGRREANQEIAAILAAVI